MKGCKEDEIMVATRCSERTCYRVAAQCQDTTRSDVDKSVTESDEENANNEALDLIRNLNNMFQLDLKSHNSSCWSKISFEKHNTRRKRIL